MRISVSRLFLSKLVPPSTEQMLNRPRLAQGSSPRLLAAIGPSGSGKSVFLAQWAERQQSASIYYRLDRNDRDGALTAAHLAYGFKRLWPDWAPSPSAEGSLVDLAADLANEAIARPPVLLVLDRLEEAHGSGPLVEMLEVLLEYAPPTFTLAVGTRTPLPGRVARRREQVHLITANDLAFTPQEAQAWLATPGWEACFEASNGFPLALALWQQSGQGWRAALAEHLHGQMPPHVPEEEGRALVDAWLSHQITLADFAHQVSTGQPGAERLWSNLLEQRRRLLSGDLQGAYQALTALWEQVQAGADGALAGAVALLVGEHHFCRGEYGEAMEWYREAFKLDPLLETTGCHSVVAILRDQGYLDEAESLGRRCLEALQSRADLTAQSCAHFYYGTVCSELGRVEEADAHFGEAERLGLTLEGEPFYGILAASQRALIHARQGRFAEFRRLAEESVALARHRSPWLEAICTYGLAPAMMAWGEHERGWQLLVEAKRFLEAIGAKWQLHMVLSIEALLALKVKGRPEAAALFDEALSLAAAENYVQQLPGPGDWLMPLLVDALKRGHELPFCQKLIVRMGERAIPALLELTRSPDPGARRAALYPLAAIGGPSSIEAIAALTHDPDELVSDQAVVALRAAGGGATPASGPASQPASRPAPQLARILLSVLGPVTVRHGDQVLGGWRTTKARDLLAYLAVHGDRLVTRSQLIEALWPESTAEAGQASLHTALYHLRRVLKPAGEEVVTYSGGVYRLNRDLLEVDYEAFQALAGGDGEEAWRRAAELYQGEPLEELDYAWCEPIRARGRALFLHALRSLSQHLRESGRPGEAIPWLQLMVQADPLSEDAHLTLMRCFAEVGNRNAALQQYRTLATLLDEELGLEPSEAARAAYQTLLD